ncbi:MAG: hypothetical protein K6C07_09485 [Bacteroidales bacterium]|nr:hypothetical protein [Bacteroidales bacterium]
MKDNTMTNKFLRISNDFNVEFAKIVIFSQRTEAFFKTEREKYMRPGVFRIPISSIFAACLHAEGTDI